MKLIVAVSGGVDSVVLLDKLVRQNEYELIVAHFDHGIRSESEADARFVRGLAQVYGLPFELRREELGVLASEAIARERRYVFLADLAERYDAQIVTAHHQDDILETIAINLTRGTGWRGLAVFGSHNNIVRPQLDVTKANIYTYALIHHLEWVEDETNMSDNYLRNRIRKKLAVFPARKKTALIKLWQAQRACRQMIEQEEAVLVGENKEYSRYFFTHIDDEVAIELLRASTHFLITRPQAARGLHAIKTLPAGATSELGSGVRLSFTKRAFTIQTL